MELGDLAPGERGPRLLFLAQLGLLVRASIAARALVPAPPTAPGKAADLKPSGIRPEVEDDLRRAIAELDLSSFSVT